MQLHTIDKQRYRRHLNITIISAIVILLTSSLLFSTVLTALFSQAPQSNFNLNLMAVIISCGIIISLSFALRQRAFFTEINYVWYLKLELNHITRQLRHLEKDAKDDKKRALIIMAFYFEASQQLYNLDDNTITLDSLKRKQGNLQQLIIKHDGDIAVDD